jgi:hypothetical protein
VATIKELRIRDYELFFQSIFKVAKAKKSILNGVKDIVTKRVCGASQQQQ